MSYYSIDLEMPSRDFIYPVKIFSNIKNKEILYIISDAIDNILKNINLIIKNENVSKKDIIIIEKIDYLSNLDQNNKHKLKEKENNLLIINFKKDFNKLNLKKKEVMDIIYKRLYPLKIEHEDYNLGIVKEIIRDNDYSYIYLTPNNNNFSYNSKIKVNNVDNLLNNKIDENKVNKGKPKNKKNKKNFIFEEKEFKYTKGYNIIKIDEFDPKIFKWYNIFKKQNLYLDFDKYILTSKFSISRISFCYGEKRKRLHNDLNCPPPINLKKEDLDKIFVHSFEDKYEGLNVCPKTGLVMTLDKNLVNSQKGVFIEVVKKLSKQIFSSNKTLKFSLPVRIFEPKTTNQKIPDFWNYIEYIKCEEDDLVRIKNSIIFFVAGLHRSPNKKKPFSPYLGETFEGNLGNIYKVYCEHIIHEPPTSFYLVEGPDISFSARLEQTINFGGSIKISYKGYMILDYKNKKRIIASFPNLQINGLILGSKSTQFSGSFKIIDITSNYRAWINFGTNKKVDEIDGVLIRGKNNEFNKKYTINKSLQELYLEDINNDMGKHISLDEFKYKKNDILMNISGNKYKEIYFNKDKAWDRLEDIPLKYQYNLDCLPSDSRFREDLIWLFYENIPIADEWKIKLEERQRLDRYLRKGKFTPKNVIDNL